MVSIPAVATDPDGVSASRDCRPTSPTLLDRLEVTQALELIWQRVRRLNRYVEERAPWQLARDPDSAGALDETLASLAEGVRVVSVLLHPYMPASDRAAARRARGAAVRLSPARRSRRRCRAARSARSSRCFRNARDRQPHAPRAVRAARYGARRRGRRCRGESDRHRRHRRCLVPRGAGGGRGLPAGVRRDRAPPQFGHGLRRRGPRRARGARGASASAWRSARPGSTTTATTRRGRTRRARSGLRSSWPARFGSPW